MPHQDNSVLQAVKVTPCYFPLLLALKQMSRNVGRAANPAAEACHINEGSHLCGGWAEQKGEKSQGRREKLQSKLLPEAVSVCVCSTKRGGGCCWFKNWCPWCGRASAIKSSTLCALTVVLNFTLSVSWDRRLRWDGTSHRHHSMGVGGVPTERNWKGEQQGPCTFA